MITITFNIWTSIINFTENNDTDTEKIDSLVFNRSWLQRPHC